MPNADPYHGKSGSYAIASDGVRVPLAQLAAYESGTWAPPGLPLRSVPAPALAPPAAPEPEAPALADPTPKKKVKNDAV